jgi:hypothetical protein
MDSDNFFSQNQKNMTDELSYYKSKLIAYQTEFPKIKKLLPDAKYYYGNEEVQNVDTPISLLNKLISDNEAKLYAQEMQSLNDDIVHAYNILKNGLIKSENCDTGHLYCIPIENMEEFVKHYSSLVNKNTETADYVTINFILKALDGDLEGADKILDENLKKTVLVHPEIRLYGPYNNIELERAVYETVIASEFDSWYQGLSKSKILTYRENISKYQKTSRHFSDYYTEIKEEKHKRKSFSSSPSWP